MNSCIASEPHQEELALFLSHAMEFVALLRENYDVQRTFQVCEAPPDPPGQQNGFDCGVCVCMNMQLITEGTAITEESYDQMRISSHAKLTI